MNVGWLQGFILTLVVVVLVAAAGSIALDDFKEDIAECTNASFAYNVSSGQCHMSDGNVDAPINAEFNITNSGSVGISNTADYFDTMGTIGGVVALIVLVVGGFAVARFRQ